jgi:hypothetical protein
VSYIIDSDRPPDLPIGVRHPTHMILICDGEHGPRQRPEQRFEGQFDEREREARAQGWRWRLGDHPIVLCRECSGRG